MSGERGQATVLVLGMTMVVFGIVGISVDGTRAFIHRRTLQSAADAAALAGAGELDASRYYASRGRAVTLDPASAEGTAYRYLRLRGLEARSRVEVVGDRVVVTLRSAIPTLFLRVVGVGKLPVAAEAASQLVPDA